LTGGENPEFSETRLHSAGATGDYPAVEYGGYMAKKKTDAAAESAMQEIDLQKFLHEIEIRAFGIYLDRIEHNLPGSEMSDWIDAETEIRKKYGL
jgi:hypothetical protein